MKCFTWGNSKNAKLKAERGVSFEDIVFHIERGDVLDVLEHPEPGRHAGQRIIVVRIESYVYLVPFDEDGDEIVLKTIMPSRKMTRKYLQRADENDGT